MFERLEDRTLLTALTLGTTSFDDDPDQVPGDLMCATSMGNCTLRAAIQEANANLGPDTINLAAGTYTLTRADADDAALTGDLDITDDVNIVGSGAATTIIDANNLDRALEIFFKTVTISGVTIKNGSATNGGGIYNNAGTLAITDSIVSDNKAQGCGGSAGLGGGIYVTSGTVTATGLTISNNQALGDPGCDGFGGGIYSDGSTWMIGQSTLSDNTAAGGGGVGGTSGGSGFGGGIYTTNFGTFTIETSTLSGNQALGGIGDGVASGGHGFGGGIYLDFQSTVSATNSTLSGNRANGGNGATGPGGNGAGGGITNASGTLNLLHATIADNHATGGSGGSPGSGTAGGIANDDTANLKSTIVATNTASTGDPDVSGFFVSPGFFVSLGHNLIGDGGSSLGFVEVGDQVGTSGSPINPVLGPLQGNGGPTFTHALITASPAIDMADNTSAPATDQRGEPRPVDGDGNSTAIADIGAFEAAPSSLAPASLSGFVYVDANNNGLRDDGSTGIDGVMVQLTGIDDLGNSVNVTTTTMTIAGVAGSYAFTGLRPSDAGGYKLTETQPAGYLDGKDTIGTPGGSTTNDMFFNIVLSAGVNGLENNFGELIPATIAGTKFTDLTGNGLTADDTPLGGVTINLFRDVNNSNTLDAADGAPISTMNTAAETGSYSFTNLAPDRYFVKESVPSEYVRTGPVASDFHTVNAASGATITARDFANFRKCDTSAVSSYSYLINGTTTLGDLTGNIHQGDQVQVNFTIAAGFSNVQISLVSYVAPAATFDPATANQQMIFESTGLFSTGSGSLSVTVPNSFFQVDFVCGPAIDRFGPAGSNIFYTPQMRLIDFANGGTQPPVSNPSSLAGLVYVDSNNNGINDAGELGAVGVFVKLTGTDNLGTALSLTRTTSPSGAYSFLGLRPGTYKLTETQPSGLLDGKDTLGSLSGTLGNDLISNIVLGAAVNGVGYNYGELQPACLSGTVYVDLNDNGVIDTTPAAEARISGVKITVTGTNDLSQSVTVAATTASNGTYSICNLRPGTYKITETQPAGFLDGIDSRGTINGVPSGTVSNDMLSGLTLAPGAAGINYNFGERPSGTTLKTGQTATIGYWKNNNGQALLNQLNGGSTAKTLSAWLASNFPKLWGSSAGTNNLSGKTNAQVAAYYANLFSTNDPPKAETQALATAFAVYATSSSLAGGSYATAYGFIVSSSGTGSAKFNVMTNGAAFGVSNNSVLSTLDLLKKSNGLAVNGVLNGGDAAKRTMSNVVYSAINETGDIV